MGSEEDWIKAYKRLHSKIYTADPSPTFQLSFGQSSHVPLPLRPLLHPIDPLRPKNPRKISDSSECSDENLGLGISLLLEHSEKGDETCVDYLPKASRRCLL
jgi:hypothetical protein